jgi:hypothetical protein
MRWKVPCLALLVTLGWLATPGPARACTCYPHSVDRDFRAATAVFWGQVVEYVGGVEPSPGAHGIYQVRFQVKQAFKGVSPGELVLESIPGWGGGDCGMGPFERGEDYIVFAYLSANGHLSADLDACGSTSWGPPDLTDPEWTVLRGGPPPGWLGPLLLLVGLVPVRRWMKPRSDPAQGGVSLALGSSPGAQIRLLGEGLIAGGSLYLLAIWLGYHALVAGLDHIYLLRVVVQTGLLLLVIPTVLLFLAGRQCVQQRAWVALLLLPGVLYLGAWLTAAGW